MASKLGSVSDRFCALGSLQHPAAGVPGLGCGVDEEEFTIQRSSDYLCTFREVMQAYSANALSRMKYAGNQDIRECLLSCADDMGAWPKVTKYVS